MLCLRALIRKETQPFAVELSQTNLLNLNELYKAIYDDRKRGNIVYTLNNEALTLYDQFDEQICQKLKQPVVKWPVFSHDNCSIRGKKGESLVLRLAVTLFVVYSYSRLQLFQSYRPVPRVIPKPYTKYAINLMTYFQQQRKEIDKVQMSNALLKKSISFKSVMYVYCPIPLTPFMNGNYYICFPSR